MEEEDIKTWDFAKKQKRDEQIHQRMASTAAPAAGRAIRAIGHHGHAEQFADVIERSRKTARRYRWPRRPPFD